MFSRLFLSFLTSFSPEQQWLVQVTEYIVYINDEKGADT
jgi:hypothetical protein